MRPLGLTLATIFAATAALAQVPAPPGTGGVPVTPGAPAAQPVAPTPPPAAPDARLDAHLNAWNQQMTKLVNFRADFDLTERDSAFQRDRKYSGSILVMKPNFARLRQDSVDNKQDYKAYICNGNAFYEYNGIQKTITEFKLNPTGNDNLMLDLVKGINPTAAKQRFQITLFKEDENYVYLDIKPLLAKDMEEFKQVRFALFGPNVKPPFTPYLPAQAFLVKPNGDAEIWAFKNPQTNIPGIDQSVFQPVKIEGWTVKAGNAAPPPMPPAPPRPGPKP